ncbi:helix-turn-helix domain-containing protein [candidate division KSB1 bacterium]
MSIVVNLDLLLVKRKMSLTELSERVGVTIANLSILKQSKVRAVRFSTLNAICREMDCQPGEILEYVPDNEQPDKEDNSDMKPNKFLGGDYD